MWVLIFTMKTVFLSLIFSGILVNAQFKFPDPEAPNPAEEIEARDQLIMLIKGERKIKESQSRLKIDNEIISEIRKFDHEGKILFSADITESALQNSPNNFSKTRNDEYKTALSDGRIVSFEYSALDEPVKKSQILYDSKNRISKIVSPGKTYEYIYEKEKLVKGIQTFEGYQEQGNYQYDLTGKLKKIEFKSVSPKGKTETSTRTIEYDKDGNTLLDAQSLLEKKYSYKNNLLTKYTVLLQGKKAEERDYEYNENGKMVKTTNTVYNVDTNKTNQSLISHYKYKNGLIVERSTLISDQEPAKIETFSYDSQNRITNIRTRSENAVVANTDVAYGKDTITLTGEHSQSVYTLYE